MTETYVETPDTFSRNTFATIDCAVSIGGYEWDQFRLLRGVDGRLYIHAASGCSCNYFDDEDPADFTPVATWQEAVKRLREWAREEREEYGVESRTTVAEEMASRLATTRPKARIKIDARNPSGGAR